MTEERLILRTAMLAARCTQRNRRLPRTRDRRAVAPGGQASRVHVRGDLPQCQGEIGATVAVPIVSAAAVCLGSADRCQESPTWAGLAKVAVIMWGAAMILI